MKVGMLWFDNDSKADLTVKIERAAAYYRSKYGRVPTLCYVHPSMLPTPAPSSPDESSDESPSPPAKLKRAGVEIRGNRTVLPNHFWIGINGASSANSNGQ